MIEICNLRNCKVEFEYDIRVDRTSVLGNPYFMRNENQRDEVCEKYQAYFDARVSLNDLSFMTELRRLYKIYRKYGKLRLFCWCAPKRCHAETIKAFLEKYIQE